MRIRKHASKLLLHLPPLPPPPNIGVAAPAAVASSSPRMSLHSSHLPQQKKPFLGVCQLNQSPWDALPLHCLSFFDERPEPLPPSTPQVEYGEAPHDRAPLFGNPDAPSPCLDSTTFDSAAAASVASRVVSSKQEEEPPNAIRKSPSKKRNRSCVYHGKDNCSDDNNVNGKDSEVRQVKEEATVPILSPKVEEEMSTTTMRPMSKKKKTISKKKKSEAIAAPTTLCKKSDGKGWNCKREAKKPYSLCEYHLSQIRSYYHGSHRQSLSHPHKKEQHNCIERSKEKKPKSGNSGKPARVRITYDEGGPEFYYYYSGFGPWRGKKRGAGKKKDGEEGDVDSAVDCELQIKAMDVGEKCGNAIGDEDKGEVGDDIGLDPESIDQVDDESSGENLGQSYVSRRRWRKPVKARSLKSLL